MSWALSGQRYSFQIPSELIGICDLEGEPEEGALVGFRAFGEVPSFGAVAPLAPGRVTLQPEIGAAGVVFHGPDRWLAAKQLSIRTNTGYQIHKCQLNMTKSVNHEDADSRESNGRRAGRGSVGAGANRHCVRVG